MYLGSGLNIQSKGFKESYGDESITANAYYLNLPIHIGTRFNMGDANRVFVQAGPQISFGIGGKEDGVKYFGEDGAKRFDLGLGAKVGYEFGNIQVNAHFNYGLMKVYDGDEVKPHNVDFGVGVAYMF